MSPPNLLDTEPPNRPDMPQPVRPGLPALPVWFIAIMIVAVVIGVIGVIVSLAKRRWQDRKIEQLIEQVDDPAARRIMQVEELQRRRSAEAGSRLGYHHD
jgi:biopolymer transport protein ExbB/TolQ